MQRARGCRVIVGAVSGSRVLSDDVPAREVAERFVWSFMHRLSEVARERGERVCYVFGDARSGPDAWALDYAYAKRAEHRVYETSGAVTGWDGTAEVSRRWGVEGDTGPLRRNAAMGRDCGALTRRGDLVVFGAYLAQWSETQGTARTAQAFLRECKRERFRGYLWTFSEHGFCERRPLR